MEAISDWWLFALYRHKDDLQTISDATEKLHPNQQSVNFKQLIQSKLSLDRVKTEDNAEGYWHNNESQSHVTWADSWKHAWKLVLIMSTHKGLVFFFEWVRCKTRSESQIFCVPLHDTQSTIYILSIWVVKFEIQYRIQIQIWAL